MVVGAPRSYRALRASAKETAWILQVLPVMQPYQGDLRGLMPAPCRHKGYRNDTLAMQQFVQALTHARSMGIQFLVSVEYAYISVPSRLMTANRPCIDSPLAKTGEHDSALTNHQREWHVFT